MNGLNQGLGDILKSQFLSALRAFLLPNAFLKQPPSLKPEGISEVFNCMIGLGKILGELFIENRLNRLLFQWLFGKITQRRLLGVQVVPALRAVEGWLFLGELHFLHNESLGLEMGQFEIGVNGLCVDGEVLGLLLPRGLDHGRFQHIGTLEPDIALPEEDVVGLGGFVGALPGLVQSVVGLQSLVGNSFIGLETGGARLFFIFNVLIQG